MNQRRPNPQMSAKCDGSASTTTNRHGSAAPTRSGSSPHTDDSSEILDSHSDRVDTQHGLGRAERARCMRSPSPSARRSRAVPPGHRLRALESRTRQPPTSSRPSTRGQRAPSAPMPCSIFAASRRPQTRSGFGGRLLGAGLYRRQAYGARDTCSWLQRTCRLRAALDTRGRSVEDREGETRLGA